MKPKFVLLFLFLVVFSSSVMAQFQPGNLMLGGSVSISNGATFQEGNMTSTGFSSSFNPSVAYFISESSAFGISPGIGFSTQQAYRDGESFGDRQYNSNGAISLFYRKYYRLAEQIYFFFEPSTSYSGSNWGDIGSRGFTVEISPGVAFRISEKWLVETSFGGARFSRHFHDSGQPNEVNTRNWNLNFTNFGSVRLQFLLQSQKQ
ncbi:outer membrane beta-barrel protein [Pleomorphovibrio marinus]|uniref:outer membrane beta-barrel protein n=1 Tax=Pleomorphovibrio marinus TaxID=2164132 RepID=UPI000E0ADB17|nr:outer membrane beta-barrel protein [Pleomorphovibrio marinus]